jgi:hypothetical protein
MDKKKVILIGSGVLAFGIVMYIVIRKFSKNKPKPQVFRCPTGYIPTNGKCKKTSITLPEGTEDYGDYTDYSYDYTEYDIYDDVTTVTPTTTGNNYSSTMVKTKSGARLRKEPNTNSEIIKTYEIDIPLVVVGESNQSDGVWYNVQEKSSISSADVKRQGWMRSDVVKDLFADERS